MDTWRSISFNLPQRVHCNKILPDSGGHLAPKISLFFSQLTSIGMQNLRNQYYPIRRGKRVSIHCVQTLSDGEFKSYLHFCTFAPLGNTLILLATKYYKHADTSKSILLNPPWPVDSDKTLPGLGGPLAAEISAFFYLLTATDIFMSQDLSHSICLGERILMRHFLTLANIWLLR